MAQRGFIRRAHRAGKKVFVWTVNDPVTKSRLLAHAAVMFGKPLPQRAYRDESP
jgi:glycerophosphoryl diester phosphodiesterase